MGVLEVCTNSALKIFCRLTLYKKLLGLQSMSVSDIERQRAEIETLQSQLAFQEDMIGDLDQALSQQQQELLVLQRQVALLAQQIKDYTAGIAAGADAVQEKPPHY